ncbi:MAG: hypothetical protein WCS42_26405, partial [Verrucomicrobiota bacterium]
LLEESGNYFYHSALLVALLRAAGYTNTQYQFGWQTIPYDDAEGKNYDLRHWWQLTLTNSVWTNTVAFLGNLTGSRAYPKTYFSTTTNTFSIQRTWVALTIGSDTYQLDPAFKISERVSGIPLSSAMNSTPLVISNSVRSAAAGDNTDDSTKKLAENAVRNQLQDYASVMADYIQNSAPNASVQDILGGWRIIPADNDWDYSTHTTFPVDTSKMPLVSWQYQPTNLMSTLTVAFAGTNHQWLMPQLQGQRLALTFDASGSAQLWLDDSNIITKSIGTSNSYTGVALAVTHPVGTWDITNNLFIPSPTNNNSQSVTNYFQSANSTYALLYAFEPDWNWLQQRQKQLDGYLEQGLPTDSRQVVSETLNVMGLNWMIQTAQLEQMLATQLGTLPQHYHRLGRMAQEAGKGYYVDVYMQINGVVSGGGHSAADIRNENIQFDLNAYFASALEHGIIEQLQNTNIVGASTVKMLQIANSLDQTIFLASSNNWTAGTNVKGALLDYGTDTINWIQTNLIQRGYYVLLSKYGSNQVSAVSGSWAGFGFEARRAANGQVTDAQMIISGGYHGGYASVSTAIANALATSYFGQNQYNSYPQAATGTPNQPVGDPIDPANGTFQVEHADLSVGQAEPRGITLSRYYNGTRRHGNPAGMAGGWLHNYYVTAATV